MLRRYVPTWWHFGVSLQGWTSWFDITSIGKCAECRLGLSITFSAPFLFRSFHRSRWKWLYSYKKRETPMKQESRERMGPLPISLAFISYFIRIRFISNIYVFLPLSFCVWIVPIFTFRIYIYNPYHWQDQKWINYYFA